MKTSYFAKYKGDKGVSIAGGTPKWFKGRQYKKLAPKYWFFKKYKDGEITYEDAINHADSENELRLMIKLGESSGDPSVISAALDGVTIQETE